MKNTKNKGTSFELSIAKQLSYWITGNTKKYVLWRSHGSGAVQTITKKISPLKGDIMVIDSIAEKFSRICVECKHYKTINLLHLLNNNTNIKNFIITMWWMKLVETCVETKSIPWLIIKQNYSDSVLCTYPLDILSQLKPNIIVKFHPPHNTINSILLPQEFIIINLKSFLKNIEYSKYIEEVEKKENV